MKRSIVLAIFTVLCIAASGARCQYTEKGKGRCVGTALKGKQYCKNHGLAQTNDNGQLYAMKEAMKYWRKYKSRLGKKWVVKFNGHNIAISADGQMTLSNEPPAEHTFYDGTRYTVYQNEPEHAIGDNTHRQRKDNRRALEAQHGIEYATQLEEYKREHPEDQDGFYFHFK